VHIDFKRRGTGSGLLELAKARSSGNLRLYTFAANRGARAFYEKYGFQIVDRGSDNEERLPHPLLEWHNRNSPGS
jgi:ribosomal protein S18 acetylase RimI-like enzyme